MNNNIVLSSVTFALRAKRLLESKGIKASVEKTSGNKEKRSCTYTLTVSESQRAKALEILNEGNIKILN